MIDTHAHLSGKFCDDLKRELKKIKKVGIGGIVLAAASVTDSKQNIKLAKDYKDWFWASVGIHPQKVDTDNKDPVDKQLNQLDQLIKENREKIVSMGETGLDFSQAPDDEEDRSQETQEKLFRGQICLALKYELPLIIHARKAVDEVIEILTEYKEVGGVFHCYAGGKKRIKKVLELGQDWYFGIDGNLTYEAGLEQVVTEIPQNKLVLETDSPFLTPVPHRGEKNDPTKVKYVYKKVAQIWGKSFEETEKIIDANAKKLFGL